MTEILRVLLVEDSEDETQILWLALQRSQKWKVEIERIETREAFLSAIDSKSWDIIFANYNLQKFSALEALALLKIKEIDLPFILISGMIEEEIAIEAMKDGAHDIVLKDQLARLYPVVERELRQAALRREMRAIEKALTEEQEKFRALFDVVPVSIFEIDCTRLENFFRELNTYEIENLQKYFDEVPEAIIHAFSNLRIINSNKAALSLLECEDTTKITSEIKRFVPPNAWMEIRKNVLKFYRGEKKHEGESILLTSSGKEKSVSFQWHLLPSNSSNGTEIFLSLIDLTDSKLFETTSKTKAETEAIIKTKDRFLANVVHELRTPLNPIIGFTELLIDTNPTLEQKRYIQIINQRCKDLLGLIGELLDFSKIEAGEMKISPTTMDLKATLDEVKETIEAIAKNKGLTVTLEIEEDLPNQIIADPLRIRQVILNLATNSVKFTNEGGIKIKVSKWREGTNDSGSANLPHTGDTITLQFSVIDTGIGIPPDKQSKLFIPFFQIEDTAAQRCEGTGLGLAIVKKLTSMMQGKIWFNSEPQKGSEFNFTISVGIPIVTPEKIITEGPPKLEIPINVTSPEIPVRKFRVLVVEDEASNRLLATALLGKMNYDPVGAESASKAIALIEKENFDLILMDIQLPDFDGMLATQKIRELEKFRRTYTPILALTAYALEIEKQIFLDSGMDGCITKPIKRNEFFKTIKETIERFKKELD
ncbi:MAG: response regulator [Candidatus Riflebacteria bacterium]|nr:response regulator [Candidatus Riflebacteria bacterium]